MPGLIYMGAELKLKSSAELCPQPPSEGYFMGVQLKELFIMSFHVTGRLGGSKVSWRIAWPLDGEGEAGPRLCSALCGPKCKS